MDKLIISILQSKLEQNQVSPLSETAEKLILGTIETLQVNFDYLNTHAPDYTEDQAIELVEELLEREIARIEEHYSSPTHQKYVATIEDCINELSLEMFGF